MLVFQPDYSFEPGVAPPTGAFIADVGINRDKALSFIFMKKG
jgi:hypothetical protein